MYSIPAGQKYVAYEKVKGDYYEATTFNKRSLAGTDYVYCWVDGIHLKIRLEQDKVCLLVMTASLATALATTAASGEDPAPSNTIKVGVIGSLFRDLPEPVFQALAKPLKTLLDSQTGRTSQLVCGGDAEYLGNQLAKDRVQLAVFNGFEFAWARLKYPEIKPLMIAVNQHRHLRRFLYRFSHDRAKSLILADVGAHVATIHVRT